jgi:hypothetical protein
LFIRHEDGSVQFWDVTNISMPLMYKLKTSDYFQVEQAPNEDVDEETWPPFRKVCLYDTINIRQTCPSRLGRFSAVMDVYKCNDDLTAEGTGRAAFLEYEKLMSTYFKIVCPRLQRKNDIPRISRENEMDYQLITKTITTGV